MKKLKILFVLHTPWGTGLGASKVHYDLKEEYEKHGHEVHYLDWNKYYPKGQSAYNKLFGPFYTDKIHRYLLAHAHKYDVIDANNACIPFPKESYGFKGLVVFRSHGLQPLYNQLENSAPYKKMEAFTTNKVSLKTRGGNLYRFLQRKTGDYELFNSINYADIVHALNKAEYEYFVEYGIPKERIALVYNGVPDAQLNVLENVRPTKKKNELCFVGSWTYRKGIKDMNSIVKAVQQQVNLEAVHLLGGGGNADNAYPFFEKKNHSLLRIKAQFSQPEVPDLLKTAKAGFFPSYAEGFGLAIIEQLALGIPVVAYDTPGPTDILRVLGEDFLVKPGDTNAMGTKLARILSLNDQEYTALSQQCKKRAEDFKMSTIAATFLDIYQAGLAKLNPFSKGT